jgi:hypothetical protein
MSPLRFMAGLVGELGVEFVGTLDFESMDTTPFENTALDKRYMVVYADGCGPAEARGARGNRYESH